MRALETLLHPCRLAGVTLLALVASCASTGGAAVDVEALGAVRASLVDYNGRTQLTLVNETYAARHAGQPLEDGMKVASDEVLGEVARFYAENDFWVHARPGKPGAIGSSFTDGGERVALVLELASDLDVGYIPLRAGLSQDEIQTLDVLIKNFTPLWSEVQGYRAMYNPAGEKVFQQPIVR